jgi:hypothetical protein
MTNTPAPAQLHIFHPEMGEKPDATRLVFMRHNFGRTYEVQWRPANDAAVRAFFKKNRIRPLSVGPGRDPISHDVPGPTFFGKERFSCLVSPGAHEKLMPVATFELLLD